MENMDLNNIKSKANEYKKIFENIDIYPYCYCEANTSYYYVSYKRFNKISGVAILTEKNNSTKHEVINAFKMIYTFNRIMSEAIDQMVPDIRKPVSVLQEIKILITEAENRLFKVFEKIKSETNELKTILDEIIDFPEKLIIILKEMQAIEKSVLDSKCLLKENVERMMELNIKHYQIMYSQGRAQLEGIKKARIILEELAQVNESERKEINQLLSHLKLFSAERAVIDVNKSQSTFEKDEYGNKITLSQGEKGLEEYKEMFYKRANHIFENNIKHNLRNFK
ncbi:hypothetical protein P4V41_20830 [Fictibacillus nanhaiensis]|uniref:hypothetical protein n=1 Tax=Fictibacillus nanhaiensis TaxID=742169 RepID=UPI002E1BE79E|nr:hypothetical protein [Fictibacillus nanhaiensis]